jgi:glycyl-tRNA synthetase
MGGDLMDKVINLAKRRGFVFPGSEIYGGLANSWDYGPLGVELKNNIRQEWWKIFVHQRADMVGIDPAIIMNPKVWRASGHVKNFADPLVECKKCHNRFRQDQTDEKKCPDCGGDLTVAKRFNLLFRTFLGPTEEQSAEVYLRGELAQAMFVDFPTVSQITRKQLPFGIAAQGKVFRNEITPGNFIFRTREFELMEFEYFVKPEEWEKHFQYWLEEIKKWLAHVGVKKEHLYFHEIPREERAHYSQRTVDIEYQYPFGQKELYGIAYRGDFDFKNHHIDSEAHVVEPTFGLDRTFLVAMLEAYHEEEAPTAKKGETDKRVVMKFPFWLAPFKCAVLPLSNKEKITTISQPLYDNLRRNFVCDYDETQSIGKRYRRQDEIGTPLCITVDFETTKDDAVTVRHRDTMKQERIKIKELTNYLYEKLSKDNSW